MLTFSIFENLYAFTAHAAAAWTVGTGEDDGKDHAGPHLTLFALSRSNHAGASTLFTFLPQLAGKEAALPSALFSCWMLSKMLAHCGAFM